MSLIKIDPVKVYTQKLAIAEAARQKAYVEEADPIFFKWQRGAATEQQWLDKIAEIKNRYPDPENTQ